MLELGFSCLSLARGSGNPCSRTETLLKEAALGPSPLPWSLQVPGGPFDDLGSPLGSQRGCSEARDPVC